MGRRHLSFRGSPFSTARVLFPGARRTLAGLPPNHPPPLERAGGVESGRRLLGALVLRRPSDPALRSGSCRAVLCGPLHLLPSPREQKAAAAAPCPPQLTLASPRDPGKAPRPRNQVRRAKFSAQGLRETREMEI